MLYFLDSYVHTEVLKSRPKAQFERNTFFCMTVFQVTWRSYWLYFKACGLPFLCFCLCIFPAYALDASGSIWLKYWTDTDRIGKGNVTNSFAVSNSQGLSILAIMFLFQGKRQLDLVSFVEKI